MPSNNFERSDMDSNEIRELEGNAPIPPKPPVPPSGPPGVMPNDDAEEPKDVFLANDEPNRLGAPVPMPGGDTVPAKVPVRPTPGRLRFP